MIAGEIEIRLMAEISRLRTDMERARRNVEEATGAMARAANMAKNALAAIGGALSLAALTQQVVAAQREFDKMNASLVTATGSVAAAGEAFGALQKFAASTPFSLQEVTEGFLKLRNMGLTPSEAALRSYGNTSSSMGKSLNQMIEAVADAATGEFERLKEFGIKAKQEGDKVALTFQGTTTQIGNNAAEIEAYLQAIGNVNFAGGMERQAATLDGALSNLNETWSQTLISFSQSGFGDVVHGSVLALTGALSDLDSMFKAVTDAAAAEGKKVSEVGPMHSALTTIFESIMALGTNVSYILTAIGRDIGAMAAQAVAAASFDFDSVRRIGEMRAADAKREREEVDRKTEAILGAAAAAKEARDKEAADRAASLSDSLSQHKILSKANQEYFGNLKLLQEDFAKGKITEANYIARVSALARTAYAAQKAEANQVSEASKKAAEAARRESEAQARLVAELSGVSGDYMAQLTRLQKIRDKGNISEARYIELITELINKQPGVRKAEEERVRVAKELADFESAYGKALSMTSDILADRLKDVETEAARNEELARTYGMTKAAIEEVEIARLEEQLAQRASLGLTLDEIEAIEKMIAAKKRNAAALGAMEQVDAASKAREEWQRAAESIEQSLTDALLRGFESGKSFGRNLVDTLKNMFSTLVLRPVIQGVMAPVAGALMGGIPGAAQAAGGGAGGALSAASSLGGIAGLFGAGGLSGSVMAGAGWLSGATSLGGSLAAAGSLAATGSLAGIASGLGMAVGALGPIALGIGAAVTVLKKGFGMGPKEFTGEQTLNGSLGAGGFMGTLDAEWVKKGGWFRSDKNGVDRNAVGAEMSAGLTSAYDAIKASSADFARVLGINADSIATRTQSLSITLGKDEAANQKAIADFFVGVGNTIAGELLPEIGKFQAQGEAASATLQRLATGYSTIEQALWSIGMSFGAVGTASLEARERLLAAAGGLEAFAANTAGFLQNFLSEAERNAPVLKMVTEQMAALGLASVDTRDEFKQVVLGLDLTTEAGAKQYGALMNLQAAFAQVYPAIDKAAIAAQVLQQRASLQEELDQLTMTSAQLLARQRDALDESNRPLFDQIQALKESRAALEAQAEAQRNATQAIKEQATSLLSGVDGAFGVLQRVVARDKQLLQERIATEQAVVAKHQALSSALRSTLDGMSVPGQELFGRQSAQAQIQAALAMAKASGSLPDADGLKRALSVVGQDASALYATQQDYLRDFYTTQNDIAALADITDSTLSIEEKSLKLLEEEGKRLDSILTSAQQQIDVLKGIDTSVLSVADAIAALGLSIASAKGNAVVASAGAVNAQYQSVLGRAPDAAGMQFWQDQAAKGVSQTDILNAIANSAEANIKSMYQATLGRAADAGGLQFWVDQVNKGVSYADIQRALEQSGEKLRGFAVGTNYVPTNMPAMIHEGERIIPAADNRELMRRLSNPEQSNAVLAAAVERLTREVEGLRAEARATATHTEKTARLFDRVIEGNEIKVKAEA